MSHDDAFFLVLIEEKNSNLLLYLYSYIFEMKNFDSKKTVDD